MVLRIGGHGLTEALGGDLEVAPGDLDDGAVVEQASPAVRITGAGKQFVVDPLGVVEFLAADEFTGAGLKQGQPVDFRRLGSRLGLDVLPLGLLVFLVPRHANPNWDTRPMEDGRPSV